MANTIEDLKALVNTKLGFARPNKFLVPFNNSYVNLNFVVSSYFLLLVTFSNASKNFALRTGGR